MKDKILAAAANSPRALEALYRASPKDFAQAFPEAFAANSGAPLLQAWNERLFFAAAADAEPSRWRGRDIGLVVALALAAGTLMKLPQFFTGIDEEWFYARNLCGIVAAMLVAYFCIQRPAKPRALRALVALGLGSLLFLNLLPDRAESQTILLATLHMPFFLWSLLGVAFLGGAWKNLSGRMDFIRYNGELAIYTTMILIGGMILTGLTLALFNLIHVDIEDWYLENVVVYGSVAAPLVATLLVDRIVGNRFKIAPLLSKLFIPLFLLTVVAYLGAMLMQHKNPFTDRDFLIAFNGLLLAVLGLCVLSISERGPKEAPGAIDFMNIALVAVTLLIDVVALSAILFRLTSYGFTPNRLAVLGGNLLAFIHLAGILRRYARFARQKGSFDALETWIAGYLPAYAAWSLTVAGVFPLAFRFR